MSTRWDSYHSSPSPALEILEASSREGQVVELALVDERIPDLPSRELIRSIKSSMQLSECRIIVMTRTETRIDTRGVASSNVFSLLKKPVRLADLHSCLAEVVAAGITRTNFRAAPPPKPGRRQKQAQEEPLFTALLAEDNRVLRKVTQRMLEKMRCRVDITGNGREALTLVQANSYDFALVNCVMPDVDGVKATATIRKREETLGTRLPIIGMLLSADEIDPAACFAAGMDACLAKRIRSRDLANLLRKPTAIKEGAKVTDVDDVRDEFQTSLPERPAVAPELAAFDQLASGTSPQVVLATVDRFIRDATAFVGAMRTGVKGRETSSIASATNDLRSKCSIVGAVSLARLCHETSAAATKGDFDRAECLVGELDSEFEKVRVLLSGKLRELGRPGNRAAASPEGSRSSGARASNPVASEPETRSEAATDEQPDEQPDEDTEANEPADNLARHGEETEIDQDSVPELQETQ